MTATGALAGPCEQRLAARCVRPSAQRGRALALAAIRETFEETGLLFGSAEYGTPENPPPGIWSEFAAKGIFPDLGAVTFVARAITPPGEVSSRYYVSLQVTDEPGVLAKVASTFAGHGISLQAVRQDGDAVESSARLGVMTHVARDADLRAAVSELAGLPEVSDAIAVMRVEGD